MFSGKILGQKRGTKFKISTKHDEITKLSFRKLSVRSIYFYQHQGTARLSHCFFLNCTNLLGVKKIGVCRNKCFN